MAERGKKLTWVIALYLVIKDGLNLVFGGFGLSVWVTFAISVVLACLLFFGVKRCNYVAAAVMVLVVLFFLPGNLRGLPGTALYLAEGLADLACAALLCVLPDIKAFFESENTQ